jgi:D-amino-acid oxidase
MEPQPPDALVLGAGIIGLTTAHELLRRGMRVEIRAREPAERTVSGVAAAIWYPFLAEPKERVMAWGAATFERLAALADDPASGVRFCDTVELLAGPAALPPWTQFAGGASPIDPRVVAGAHTSAMRVRVPVVDVPRHLPWLVERVRRLGGQFVTGEVASLDEALRIAPRVANCTGLGAAALCSDHELRPVRGQVVVVRGRLVDEALIDDTTAQPFYAIPREHDVVLGGTAQHGDERLTADPADTASILAALAERLPSLRGAPVAAVKVGLRPYRSTVRLEPERRATGLVVHNYGHGGSGYTLAWGCAAECAALLAG